MPDETSRGAGQAAPPWQSFLSREDAVPQATIRMLLICGVRNSDGKPTSQ